MNLRKLKNLVHETIRAEQKKKGQKPSKRNWNALIENTIKHVMQEGEENSEASDNDAQGDSSGFRVIDSDPVKVMEKLKSLSDPKGAFQNENPEVKDRIQFKTGIKLAPGQCEPTQDCIVAAKSMKDQCQNNFDGLEKALTGGLLGANGGSPIVIFQAGGVNYVLDGHHRWSQFCCSNPDRKDMECSALVVEGMEDSEAALAVCHAAIIYLTGKSITKGGNEDNLLEMDQSQLYERALTFCKENFAEPGIKASKSALEVIKEHAPETLKEGTKWYKSEGEMETWANYLAFNGANKLKGPENTNDGKGFPRIVMPQLADQGIDVSKKDGGQGLDKGEVNIKDPISESIDLQRWNKLAGLLKD